MLTSHKLFGRKTGVMPILHLWKLRFHVLLHLQMQSDLVIDQVIALYLPLCRLNGIIKIFTLFWEEEESSSPDKIKSL